MGAERRHRDGVAADAGGLEPGPADQTEYAQQVERLRDCERLLAQREEVADARDKIADRRDAAADAREQIADRREAAADAREQIADQRDAAADAREERLDAWQERLSGGAPERDPDTQNAWEAIERARALVASGVGRMDRSAAALLRREAREVRQEAQNDRNVANMRQRSDAVTRRPNTGMDKT
ncbi:hypothetical protein K7711_43850 [Nocardia sp. CA2R105]|uniref:hypothetical protein n=1 Tax=Nocardia coffeae TaxID=2873381 RepID=UPI001CA65145|nr:hypothetical protein [Nocardia coffeae]MBY8863466.1 hypothetical protein [Nocardia coffeae]